MREILFNVLDGTELTCIKKAKRHDRSRPVSEMLLMMFRSAARERKKGKEDEDR